jgi:serine phosphatase RsbU (regulator of sigma subunit)
LLRHRGLAAGALLSAVVDEVRLFSKTLEQHDDITMIVVKTAAS